MEDIAQLVADLVAIDSINPDLVPGAAGEAEAAHYVAQWMRRAGLEVQIDEPAPGRPNVIGIVRGTGGGKSLMLNGHLDTVGVAGMSAPHQPRIEGNRLYGRGAFDMKASVAACLVAAARARQLNLRGDLIVTAVSDEEYASIGTESIAKQWRADAAIVTEPTDLQVCIAHKGFVWLDVATQGVAAHGSRPDLGVDAIVKMGHFLVELEKLDLQLRANPTHRLLKSGSVHASLISGGQELSSYPERCLLQIERRTVPGEDLATVEAQIQAILDQLAARDATFKGTATSTFVRLPFEIATDTPIVRLVTEQVARAVGKTPAFTSGTGWMDSAILSAAGIPTVIFGPTGAGAHAVEEWVDLDSVRTCADVLLATAQAFCV